MVHQRRHRPREVDDALQGPKQQLRIFQAYLHIAATRSKGLIAESAAGSRFQKADDGDDDLVVRKTPRNFDRHDAGTTQPVFPRPQKRKTKAHITPHDSDTLARFPLLRTPSPDSRSPRAHLAPPTRAAAPKRTTGSPPHRRAPPRSTTLRPRDPPSRPPPRPRRRY